MQLYRKFRRFGWWHHSFYFQGLINDVFGTLGTDCGWIRIDDGFIFQYRTIICPKSFSERYGYTTFLNLWLIRVRIAWTYDASYISE